MSFKYLTLSANAVYLTGVLVGFHIEADIPVMIQETQTNLQSFDQPKSELLWSIVGNNILVALINIGGGFSLGAISILNTFYNGVVLGYALSVAGDNFSFALIFRHLLPHAIEIAAIILSCSLGFYLGLYLFKKFMLGKGPVFEYHKFLVQAGLTLIILLLAAILEVYISFSG